MILAKNITEIFIQTRNIYSLPRKNYFNLSRNYYKLSSNQVSDVVDALNDCTDDGLAEYNLPNELSKAIKLEKTFGEKILDHRSLINCGLTEVKMFVFFHSVFNEELDIEILRDIILKSNPCRAPSQILKNSLEKKRAKKYVKKNQEPLCQFNSNLRQSPLKSFICLNFLQDYSISYCTTSLKTITDYFSNPIFPTHEVLTVKSLNKMADGFEIYKIISKILKKFPTSDAVVIENQSYAQVKLDHNLNKVFNMLKGVLFAMMDYKQVNKVPVALFSPSAVINLFNLMVGGEKVSSLELGEAILGNSLTLPWIGDINFSPNILQKYILSTQKEKSNFTDTILLTISYLCLHYCDEVALKRMYNLSEKELPSPQSSLE